jgi:hypothetical protein
MKHLKITLIAATIMVIWATAGAALAAEASGKLKVQIPASPELYITDPQPLTIAQCGQCHPSLYKNLKDDGGKHRFDCQKCHASFHVYNPRKANYDAIMPKCATCHNDPHGPKVTDCATCHTNPHAPKKVAMTARLTNACGQCHTGPQEQLVKFPSKHTKVACTKCHTSHGYKPSCFACHKPHHTGQELATCTKCHPVHQPKQITYGKDSPAVTCGACHTKVYGTWQKTTSKHGKVNCATCHHTKHKYVPQCTECHPKPHNKAFLARFPKCLTCHLDVHDLPVGGKK